MRCILAHKLTGAEKPEAACRPASLKYLAQHMGDSASAGSQLAIPAAVVSLVSPLEIDGYVRTGSESTKIIMYGNTIYLFKSDRQTDRRTEQSRVMLHACAAASPLIDDRATPPIPPPTVLVYR